MANAAKTWRQLLRAGDGVARARGVRVDDWPAMPFRGVHIFTGKGAREMQLHMVREILGPLKINTLVYQCEFIKWACAPKLHHPKFGMEKADAQAVADEARRQHIEVVPLINTLGHSEWLVGRPAYLHLADDAAKPYTYDASNPEVYDLCGKVYSEAIEMFRPRVFNIGHDEIYAPTFPNKPATRAKGGEKVILEDIAHWHRFLAERGIRTMIWGDMFLAPDLAGRVLQGMRNPLPRLTDRVAELKREV